MHAYAQVHSIDISNRICVSQKKGGNGKLNTAPCHSSLKHADVLQLWRKEKSDIGLERVYGVCKWCSIAQRRCMGDETNSNRT